MSSKRFTLQVLCLTLVCLLTLGGFTAYVDPFFHYHAPHDNLEYPINNQRYQNNGILKHFEYDAIITGTSMTENFKASEFDSLFGVTSIKVPLSGSLLRETTERLNQAFNHNSNIKYVVRSLDYYVIISHKDALSDFSYPNYLYDSNPLNDVHYLLNKSILFDNTVGVIKYTNAGNQTTSFDDYSRWSHQFNYGKQDILSKTSRPEKTDLQKTLTNSDIQLITENIQQNIVSLAVEHPDTEFYLFFPPYSIVYWDHWNQTGRINAGIDAYQLVAEILLEYNNIHLFSFNNCFDMICNLDNYKDAGHYGEWINSQLLTWMKDGQYELTKETYAMHFEEMRTFYSTYNYDSIYE